MLGNHLLKHLDLALILDVLIKALGFSFLSSKDVTLEALLESVFFLGFPTLEDDVLLTGDESIWQAVHAILI